MQSSEPESDGQGANLPESETPNDLGTHWWNYKKLGAIADRLPAIAYFSSFPDNKVVVITKAFIFNRMAVSMICSTGKTTSPQNLSCP